MRPYYQDNLVTLYHGDCLEVMLQLEAQSFDAVITDEPYGTTNCAWDSIIPFDAMWTCLRRLVKPKGAIVLFGSQPFTSALVMSNLTWFKYSWVWEKNSVTNFYNTPFQPGKIHEDIVVFSDGAASYSPLGNMTYNPQMERGEPWRKRDTGRATKYRFHTPKRERVNKNNGERCPKSIINFPIVQRTWHETEKPLELMEYLVKTYTNEGDLLLDFTCGSGTTLRAAKNLKRQSVGIELLEEYCQVAVKRLAPAFEEALIAEPVEDLGPLFAV